MTQLPLVPAGELWVVWVRYRAPSARAATPRGRKWHPFGSGSALPEERARAMERRLRAHHGAGIEVRVVQAGQSR